MPTILILPLTLSLRYVLHPYNLNHFTVMPIQRFRFCLVAALLLITSSATAQMIDPQTAGYRYILAFPDTSTNTYDTRYVPRRSTGLFAMVYSAALNNRVRITNIATKRDTTYILTQGKIGSFLLGKEVVRIPNTPSNNTWLIESENPIVVYGYMTTPQGSEMWSALPVERWGKEYYANLMPGDVLNNITPGGEFNYVKRFREAPAEVLVVASSDSTRVVIHPSGRTVPEQDSVVVLLKAYQAYQIQSWVDTSLENNLLEVPQPDLTGTRITANKPISVLCANSRTANRSLNFAGLGQNVFKNPLIESVAPVEQWGREFVYTPTWDGLHIPDSLDQKRIHEWAKFITKDPATPVALRRWQRPDNATETFSIAGPAGQQMQITTPTAAWFQADQPASAMMSSSAVISFNPKQDSLYTRVHYDALALPYMVEMVPREQWPYAAPFAAVISNTVNYANIVTDLAAQPRLRLMMNNTEVAWPAPWTPIPNSSFVWSSFKITPGATYLVFGADTNARFCGFVYGFEHGEELYRPGKIKKSEGPMVSGGGNQQSGNPQLMHPSEYEEYCGLGYGYPLAPRRSTIVPGPTSAPSLLPETLLMSLRVLSANPFSNVAELECSLPHSQQLLARISNVFGETIAVVGEGTFTSGIHHLRWYPNQAAPGIYFCEVITAKGRVSVPLILVR